MHTRLIFSIYLISKSNIVKINIKVCNLSSRTFLAWIRTSIGIMAFGFIITKFFATSVLNQTTIPQSTADGLNYYIFLGIFLVFLGAAAGFLAVYRYIVTEKQIIEDTYRPSIVSDVMVAILLGSIGLLLAIYLVKTL